MSKVMKKVAMFYCMFNEYSNIITYNVFLCTGCRGSIRQYLGKIRSNFTQQAQKKTWSISQFDYHTLPAGCNKTIQTARELRLHLAVNSI